ncbi:MAG: 50S ribosomal protein L15 [Flavobacteriales bacterium]|jgi:large subunit ribosomal protein L15|uniref:50S ribosomal protein L15 n=1 Tax=Blattabacterium sp. (Mastotermes darwiniensis) TaxID=39768 RepID=UPI000231DE61|nr:50S ribosomal protein L15 [Blattabacterium sp. (Mastotermes darwiniensis)]AER40661.1 putative 50S ribosomal protein L15 [Blattabacterium sp. (Mastotermes darwiniensis) str. MADAR]MDR1804811.1 50S ribosomal protein L15 [Flavobacteriales bacterium]
MKLNFLKPKKGSKKKKLRLGRGQGSGKGGTCGRGHKGAKSRSGYSKKFGFEGGQMPIQRRIPKFGFKNSHRKKYSVMNLDTLQKLVDKEKISNIINKKTFLDNHLVKKYDSIKILAGKEILRHSLIITASKFSKKAMNCIKQAGGKALFIKENE